MNKQTIIPCVARWILFLQDFTFKIEHKAGSQMHHVDALSRNFPPDSTVVERVLLIHENDCLREAQDQNPKIKTIKDILLSSDLQNNKNVFNQYDLRGNKLFKITSTDRKWVVSKHCRWQIVKANHDDIDHFAFDKTLARIKENY